MEYEITYIGDSEVKDIRHIGINYNGNYYSVIFGKYINGASLAFQTGIVVVSLQILRMFFGIRNQFTRHCKKRR